MIGKLQTATEFVNKETDFNCRRACMNTEGSVLHHHDYYEIFLTLTDNVYHFINGQEEYLSKDTLVFIRKSDCHAFNVAPNNKDEIFNIAFKEEILNQLFTYLSNGFPSEQLLNEELPPKVILNSMESKKIMCSIENINTLPIEQSLKRSFEYRNLLVTLFYKYFSNYFSIENSIQNFPLWLRDFNNKIKLTENFSKSTADIIKLSGKSREYLARTIKKYYGVTFANYINDIRLNYIANSLLTTDLDIIELVYDAGYQNLSYAYTLFKKKFGMTPKMMRETSSIQLF